MPDAPASIHASAVLVGSRALLIRGPSGSGKSRLALDLVEAAQSGRQTFARLVADDRALVEAVSGRLLVRPTPGLEGLIEIRGLGIRRLPFEPVAVIGLVIDLAAADAERLPEPENTRVTLDGVSLPRLALGAKETPQTRLSVALHALEEAVERG
jgi:HPr kinase/phosphorylase